MSEQGAIFTVGYSGLRREDLLREIDRLDATLVDVRLVPRSRDGEFDGSALAAVLGPRYVHAKGLGNVNFRSGGPVELHDPLPWLDLIESQYRSGRRLVLMCTCRDWRRCHRADITASLEARGLPVTHIGASEVDGRNPSLPWKAAEPK